MLNIDLIMTAEESKTAFIALEDASFEALANAADFEDRGNPELCESYKDRSAMLLGIAAKIKDNYSAKMWANIPVER